METGGANQAETRIPASQQPSHRPLAENVLGAGSGIVLGFASAAPAVSLAGVLGGLAGASGYGALLALFIGFLPLLGIAFGFYYLNRWRPDVGISYSWVGRILNPYLGAFVGLLIIIAFVVSNAFSIIPAASTLLSIFLPKLATNNWAITVTGTLFLIGITTLVVAGIRIAANFQWVITSLELLIFSTFGIWALVDALSHHPAGYATPSIHWFSLSAAGGSSGLVAGLLISVFWYSGWETAVVVNEETKRRFHNPGLAGIWALVGVLIASLVLSAMFFSRISPAHMFANTTTWLPDLGIKLAGRPWGDILALAITSGFVGGIETTIITFGRVAFSMGRDGVLPAGFATVGKRRKTPWVAMIALSVPSFAIFIFDLWFGSKAIGTVLVNLSSSIGLMFVVYYALTGATAAWMLRGVVFKSVTAFVTGLVLPLGGAAFLIWVGIKAATGLSHSTLITFFVTIAICVLIVVLSRLVGKTEFYKKSTQVEIELAPSEDQ
jgi:amino acid transporter